MRVIPLGGAREVGASSAILEIANTRLLIDAGIRVGSGSRKGAFPDFDEIPGSVDAVIITHAHTDHTGALPLLGNYPEYLDDALIHMTTPTLHLLEILQRDAVRHTDPEDIEGDSGRVGYTVEQVEGAISRVVTHSYHRSFCPVPGRDDIVIEYIPCGHILGAAMLLIDTPEGRVLWTGDISVQGQPTIGGLNLDWVRQQRQERTFDLVVSEGTYGTDVHPSLDEETARFLDLLENITQKGGKVLIPAFAVGRAQDITRVIRKAKLQGRFQDVPVYLDGMVQPVTSIYENIVHETYPHINDQLQLLDPEQQIYKANSGSRSKLVADSMPGPAIAIASSGMLIGGRSVQYAKAFAGDPDNAILISGYQDEEAPGRRLLNLEQGGRLRLGEDWVDVECFVGRYHISAHADYREIRGLLEAARAKKIFLVHGETSSLKRIEKDLQQDGKDKHDVLVPRNTKQYYLHPDQDWEPGQLDIEISAPHQQTVEPLETGPNPTEPEVRELWEQLSEEDAREYAEAEIARMFLGPHYTPAEREILSDHLSDHRMYFITGGRLGQRSYRPRPEGELVDMMMDRANAYQVPIERGDLVIFSDGSPDLFAAVAQEEEGDEPTALVPFSPRKSFRRDWIRCRTALNVENMLDQKPIGYSLQWIEGVVREARSLPECDPVDAYYWGREESPDGITPQDALGIFFPRRDGMYSSAMHVATGLALGGANALFSLNPDGTFQPRDVEDVIERWPAFRRIKYVREREEGEKVQLDDGTYVELTGVYYPDSFEALEEGAGEEEFTRCNYRHVLLPGEEPSRETPSSEGERAGQEGAGTTVEVEIQQQGEAHTQLKRNGRKLNTQRLKELRKKKDLEKARKLAEQRDKGRTFSGNDEEAESSSS